MYTHIYIVSLRYMMQSFAAKLSCRCIGATENATTVYYIMPCHSCMDNTIGTLCVVGLNVVTGSEPTSIICSIK
jgi:hypothetical protein